MKWVTGYKLKFLSIIFFVSIHRCISFTRCSSPLTYSTSSHLLVHNEKVLSKAQYPLEDINTYFSSTPRRQKSSFQGKDTHQHRLVSATLRFARLSQRKTLRVLYGMKGKSLYQVFKYLEYSPRRPSRSIYTLLKSALANAKVKYGEDNIRPCIYTCICNHGGYLKRVKFASKAHVHIQKRPLIHLTIVLSV